MSNEILGIYGLFEMYDCTIDLKKKCNIFVGPNGAGKTSILKILNYLGQKDFIGLSTVKFERLEWSYSTGKVVLNYKDLFPNKKSLLQDIKQKISNNIDESNRKSYLDEDINKDFNGDMDHYYDGDFHEPVYFDPDLDNGAEAEEYFNSLRDDYVQKDYDQQDYQEKKEDSINQGRKKRKLNQVREFIELMDKKNIFYNFLSNCYFKIQQPQNIVKILNEYNGFDGHEVDDYNQFFYEILDSYAYTKGVRYFRKSAISKEYVEWDKNHLYKNYFANPFKDISYIDFVNSFSIDNNPVKESLIVSDVIDWTASIIDQVGLGSNRSLRGSMQKIGEHVWDNSGNELLLLFKGVYQSFEASYIDEGNPNYYIDEQHKKSLDDIFIKRIIEDRILEINMLISRHYYKSGFTRNFNKQALTASQGCLDCLLGQYKPTINTRNFVKKLFDDDEYIGNVSNYFLPILINNSIVQILYKKLQAEYKNKSGIYQSELLKPLSDFYYNELTSLMDDSNRSFEIVLFEKLLKKYIKDKEIVIYPSGIRFFKKQDVQHCHKGKAVKNERDSIDLSLLSSGEKKILLLLSLAILIKDKPIILDEPELSLSFVWQEELLPDMLDNSDSHLFVATHSPYIVSNDSLEDYLVFLPMEVQ